MDGQTNTEGNVDAVLVSAHAAAMKQRKTRTRRTTQSARAKVRVKRFADGSALVHGPGAVTVIEARAPYRVRSAQRRRAGKARGG